MPVDEDCLPTIVFISVYQLSQYTDIWIRIRAYIYIYNYICVCACVCVYFPSVYWNPRKCYQLVWLILKCEIVWSNSLLSGTIICLDAMNSKQTGIRYFAIYFRQRTLYILTIFPPKFVPVLPAILQNGITWHWTGDIHTLETMMTQ